MHKVAIIIPTCEPSNLLEECLLSILTVTNQEGISRISELVIIDTSDEGMWKSVAQFNNLLSSKGITLYYVISTDKRLHVEASNIGINLTKSEYILFLNDDTKIPITQGHWLSRMIEVYEANPDAGIITPISLYKDHLIFWCGTCEDWRTNTKSVHEKFRLPFDFIPKPPSTSDWSNLACALTTRTLLNMFPYDGIDPETLKYHPHYIADHFLGEKIVQQGYKNLVCRDIWIYHYNVVRLKPKTNIVPIKKPRPQPQTRHLPNRKVVVARQRRVVR